MFNRTMLDNYKNLRLRFADGENGAGGDTDTNTAGTATGEAAGTGSTDAASTGTTDTGTASTATAEKVEDLPAWAQKIITEARKGEGDQRVAAKSAAENATKALTDKLAVALGLKPDAATDPAALTASLTKAQQEAKTAALKLGVYQNASAHQGNPDALLDSNTFLASVSALDPSAADFKTQVSDAIKAAVAANPTLKAARAAGASSVDTSGGTGETGQITEAQLAQMKPAEIEKAFNEGKLAHLLG